MRNDASPRRRGFLGGHRHLIFFERSAPDEDGISGLADFVKADEILFRGETRRGVSGGGDFAISGDCEVSDDAKCHRE